MLQSVGQLHFNCSEKASSQRFVAIAIPSLELLTSISSAAYKDFKLSDGDGGNWEW